jgi:2,3-bisphosphoglycerate-independent phosphoglycerate mutase
VKKHLIDLLNRTRVEQQRRQKGSPAQLAAFRELHRQLLQTGERVPWNYPDVDPDRKYRHLSRLEAAKLVEEGDEGLQAEIHRIYQKYVDDFIRCLSLHEKRYNLGKMPAVYIPNRWSARFAAQHMAQMKFHMALGEIIIDADEETNLLDPGTDPLL